MKRWTELWSSFPAAHKKRCYQGLAAWGLLMLVTVLWVFLRADSTVKDWQDRIPSAAIPVKNVYLTPQIADITAPVASDTGQLAASDDGKAPVVDDGKIPVVDDGKIYVSIIVSNLGLSSLATERAMDDLPPQVTLAFSPYGDNLGTLMKKAQSDHHETLMLLPMETATYPLDDPGPRALSSRFSDEDNDENLKWLLTQGAGSDGVINLMGSRFLTDKKRLASTFATLRKNNALFIQTPDIDKSAAAVAAAQAGLPYMAATLQIDSTATAAGIHAQLDALEQTAQKRGYAIGIAQPYPLTLNILKSWAAGLEAKGITLAPLKTIWKNKPHYEDTAPQQPPAAQLKQP